MLDFTSALYLGMRHESWSLEPWRQLTTGRPAALVRPHRAAQVSQVLAALQGCESATLAPSTLHLFWDLFGMLAGERVAIHTDAGIYPISQWGVERAAARGVPVWKFPHHDSEALRRHLKQHASRGSRPLVVADGFCPACGRSAPVADYLECVRRFGGYLIVDDTQALGIFGARPDPGAPYGRGGGGSLRWMSVSGADVLVISSLAKGFGAPVAALSGSTDLIRRFEQRSETQMHTSAPSAAVIHAAEHALSLNRRRGDALRLRLARLIGYLRCRLAEAGLSVTGGMFPVQTLAPVRGLDARVLYARLLRAGVRSVLHGGRNGHQVRCSFLITTLHQPSDIDRAVDALVHAGGKEVLISSG